MMGQPRPDTITSNDLGPDQFPHNILIQPIATEDNTGPDYDTSDRTAVRNGRLVVEDVFSVSPHPADKEITLTIAAGAGSDVGIDLLNLSGKQIRTIAE